MQNAIIKVLYIQGKNMLDYVIYIGRFQPFHNGHYASIQYGLSKAKYLIIVLGGYRLAPSITDPWTAKERKDMILKSLHKSEQARLYFIYVRDRLYNEDLWKENVVQDVHKITKSNGKIGIIGHLKDESSYYLKIFPQWPLIETGNFYHLNGTQLRELYFLNDPMYDSVPNAVQKFLKIFRKKKTFQFLQEEFKFFQSKNKSNHINNALLYLRIGNYLYLKKRKSAPGKNLYSLPNTNEVKFKFNLSPYFLAKRNFYKKKYDSFSIGKDVFAYQIPFSDSLHFDLDTQKDYEWILLDDLYLNEEKIYADHYQIISTLLLQFKSPS